MNRSLVSVILPAYNGEKYILQALDSVKKQKYPNWEIIIVEDGTKDRTEEIVNKFAKEEYSHRVVFVRNETNIGLAATRNVAIQRARGKYIAFLDQDDIWMENYLEESIKDLEQKKADIVYASTLLCDESGKIKSETYGPSAEELDTFPISLYYRNYITPSATIIRKNVINKIGLFDSNLRSCEDYDYWIRMARANLNFTYIKSIYCSRRRHALAMTWDMKPIREQCLYVMKKHRHWSLISKKMRTQREAGLLDTLGYLWKKESPLKSAQFFLLAWLKEPFNAMRIHRLASLFKYLIKNAFLSVRH